MIGVPQPDGRFHLFVDRVGDAIHAADRLQHGRLHVDDGFENLSETPHLRRQDFAQRQWIDRLRCFRIAAGPMLETGTRIAAIDSLAIKAGVEPQELAEAVEFVLRHGIVQRILVDRLRQQLADPAVQVVDHLPSPG